MHPHHSSSTEKKFILSIVLTSLILVAELIGGYWSGSLALLSDAAHVFSDVFALGLSYFALRLAARPPDDRHSYGWHRAEVLAALVNGASLLVISIGIWVEAYKRWQSPLEIRSREMLIIAVIGLLVNLVVVFILSSHEHGEKQRNLNVHSAFLHVVGDLISSVGVIIAAILISITSAQWIDPLVSILIGALILVSAYRILRRSIHILIEGVPEGLSISEINSSIREVNCVKNVHDLHVWNLCSESISLSAHITLEGCDEISQPGVLAEINALLDEKYGIQHTTLQLENIPCSDGQGGCN